MKLLNPDPEKVRLQLRENAAPLISRHCPSSEKPRNEGFLRTWRESNVAVL